ncbi:histone H3.v1-like [Cydia amplana]|uniref:histone H3.v1-like n=1 Tax=Cydia amplana TaxID=1869771 RepID=UPI002FE5D694
METIAVNPVFGDKQLKRKLVKSIDSVKKKFKSLQSNRAELATSLEETFQPITKPLNVLISKTKTLTQSESNPTTLSINDKQEKVLKTPIKETESESENEEDLEEEVGEEHSDDDDDDEVSYQSSEDTKMNIESPHIMPINKFGRYLNENNHSSPFGDKLYIDYIECEGKRLQHVQKGVYKDDTVNKEQLDDVFVKCLAKIKENKKSISGLLIRLQALEERFTAPIAIASPSLSSLVPLPTPVTDKKRVVLKPAIASPSSSSSSSSSSLVPPPTPEADKKRVALKPVEEHSDLKKEKKHDSYDPFNGSFKYHFNNLFKDTFNTHADGILHSHHAANRIPGPPARLRTPTHLLPTSRVPSAAAAPAALGNLPAPATAPASSTTTELEEWTDCPEPQEPCISESVTVHTPSLPASETVPDESAAQNAAAGKTKRTRKLVDYSQFF